RRGGGRDVTRGRKWTPKPGGTFLKAVPRQGWREQQELSKTHGPLRQSPAAAEPGRGLLSQEARIKAHWNRGAGSGTDRRRSPSNDPEATAGGKSRAGACRCRRARSESQGRSRSAHHTSKAGGSGTRRGSAARGSGPSCSTTGASRSAGRSPATSAGGSGTGSGPAGKNGSRASQTAGTISSSAGGAGTSAGGK